jgi:archaellum component FlaG (FlaF/FlaG flagellin family)
MNILAIVAIIIIASMIASVLVITATMLSSRLNQTEGHLTEEYEVDQSSPDVPLGEKSQSSS